MKLLITLSLAAALALAALRWFAGQGGASGPGLKPIDLVVIAGAGFTCWVGYLAVTAILPLLMAIAFSVAVEMYIRERRKRWLRVDPAPRRQVEPTRPEVARAHRICEPAPQLEARALLALPQPSTRPPIARPAKR